jgi:hypothetical protein
VVQPASSYHRFVDRIHPDDYRQEEVRKLKHAIRAKENRLVVGMPDIGMSNLLRFLVTRTDWGERIVTFAYVDCGALDDCFDSEIFFTEIARQFYEQNLGTKPEKNVQGYERLKSVVLRAGEDPLDRLVVIVNNADRMLVKADKAFYRKLKALTDLNKRICYIFAVGPQVADRVDPDGLLFAGRRLMVGRFNERDFAGAVVEEAQRLEVEFDPTEQAQLAYLSGGHPGLLRAISSATVEEELDLSDLEITLERLQTREDMQARCQKIWQALNPAQQATLHAIAIRQQGSVAQETLAWLRNFGLVDEHPGEGRLFSPVFEKFVAAQEVAVESAIPETRLECIRIDRPSTICANGQEIVVSGKIYQGHREVQVASLELRLIACLKREPKIYTKDEIAQYVYYEEAGVVIDNRIENLVRQVRKRLGNPDYIKTHWGQGYEFIDGC